MINKIKKCFLLGLLIIVTIEILHWIIDKLIAILNTFWHDTFNDLFGRLISHESTVYDILLIIFALSGTCFIGFLLRLKISKKLLNILLKLFSQSPTLSFIIRLLQQITKESESLDDKKFKVAMYKHPMGENKVGIVKLKQIELNIQGVQQKEIVAPWFWAMGPYFWSGFTSHPQLKYMYEITNIPIKELVKYTAACGMFFELPKELDLKKITIKSTD